MCLLVCLVVVVVASADVVGDVVIVVRLPWSLAFIPRPGAVPRSVVTLISVVGCMWCTVLCCVTLC